jgi:hypothetical protein
VESARAYAEKAKTFSSPKFVMQSDNFLSEDRGKWKDFIPKAKATAEDTQALIAKLMASPISAVRDAGIKMKLAAGVAT